MKTYKWQPLDYPLAFIGSGVLMVPFLSRKFPAITFKQPPGNLFLDDVAPTYTPRIEYGELYSLWWLPAVVFVAIAAAYRYKQWGWSYWATWVLWFLSTFGVVALLATATGDDGSMAAAQAVELRPNYSGVPTHNTLVLWVQMFGCLLALWGLILFRQFRLKPTTEET